MGGYGAWKLGLGASETFGAAASLSGCLDIIEDVGRHLDGDTRDAALFRGIYGSLEQLEGSDNDLMALAKKLKTSGNQIPDFTAGAVRRISCTREIREHGNI